MESPSTNSGACCCSQTPTVFNKKRDYVKTEVGILAAAAVPLKKASFQTRYLEFYSPNTNEVLLFPFCPIFCLGVHELMTADSILSAGVVAMTNVCYLLRVRVSLHYSHLHVLAACVRRWGGLKRGRCGGTLITRSA